MYIYLFCMGMICGSALLCRMDRGGKDWWTGRSRCEGCDRILSWYEIIPVLGYVICKGHCRECGKKISLRYPLVEILYGVILCVLYKKYANFPAGMICRTVVWFLLPVISLQDIRTYRIPDKYIGIGILNRLLYFMYLNAYRSLWIELVTAIVVSGAVFLLSYGMACIRNSPCMGFGDIKLYFMLSLYLRPYRAVMNVAVSAFLGLAMCMLGRKRRIPFGPAICISFALLESGIL